MKAGPLTNFIYFHHFGIIAIMIILILVIVLPFALSTIEHESFATITLLGSILITLVICSLFTSSLFYANNESKTITATYLYQKEKLSSYDNEQSQTVYYFKANNKLLKIDRNQLPTQDSDDSDKPAKLNLKKNTRIKVKFMAFRDAKGKLHDVKVDTLSYSTKDKTTPKIPNKKFDFDKILK